jgi:antitoxin component of MazEF toxin-antitoxin module
MFVGERLATANAWGYDSHLHAEVIMQLEVQKIGDSIGVILPSELLARLQIELGDKLSASEGPDRSIVLIPCSVDDAETMRIARDLMTRYAPALRTLAK